MKTYSKKEHNCAVAERTDVPGVWAENAHPKSSQNFCNIILVRIKLFCHWAVTDPMDYSIPGFLSFTVSWSWLKLMPTESAKPSKHLILCRPLILLPSIFPSIGVFSNESALCIRWLKYWSFTSVLPMNIQGWFPLGLSGLISLWSQGLSRVFTSTTVQKH